MISTRNPYPFPAYEGDDDFMGKSMSQKPSFPQPAHLAQQEDTWNRLTYTTTVSRAQKEASCDDVPTRDSLDFALETKYDQHREFLKDKSETLLQKETLKSSTNSAKKAGQTASSKCVSRQTHGHPVRIVEAERREHPSSVKTAISSHHTQTTNVGYSRKPDGGFYVS